MTDPLESSTGILEQYLAVRLPDKFYSTHNPLSFYQFIKCSIRRNSGEELKNH